MKSNHHGNENATVRYVVPGWPRLGAGSCGPPGGGRVWQAPPSRGATLVSQVGIGMPGPRDGTPHPTPPAGHKSPRYETGLAAWWSSDEPLVQKNELHPWTSAT